MDAEPPPDAGPTGARVDGDVLGPYRLDRLLGRGGMGEVYRAWDDRRRRWVALKLLDPWTARDPEFRRRFRREAELAARLTDPHVLPVHDYGEIDGRLFLDMRLVDGPDLARVLADGPIARARAVSLLTQVASALDAAHAQGLVHRDVKPSNVLVASGDFAYVVDFGIARELPSAVLDGHSPTPGRGASGATGGVAAGRGTDVFGTAGYVAPERLRGEDADGRADAYSLACVAFECLTGRAPYVGDDPAAVVAEQLHGPVPRACAIDPSLPPELDVVLTRGLAPSPADRYPDAGGLGRAVEEALGAATPSGPAPNGAGPSSSAPTGVLPPPTREGPPTGFDRARSGLLAARWGPGRLAALVGVVLAVVLVVVLGVVAVRSYVGDGLSVGLSPIAVAPSADGDRVLVAGGGTTAVTVLDTGPGGSTRRVPIEGRTVGAGADRDRLAVTTVDGRPGPALVTLDLATAGVATVTSLPAPPTGPPSLTRDGARAAVPTRDGVALVDVRTGAATSTSIAARAVAITPDGDRVYSLDGRSTTVGVLRAGGPAPAVGVGATAQDLRLSPDGRVLAVLDDAPALTLVDTGSDRVLRRVDLPGRPSGITFTPDGARVLVGTDRAPGTDGPAVVAVDRAAGRVVDTYPREPFATTVALAVSPDGGRLYVANTDLGTLTVDALRR